jgi:hypothetical protein
MCMEYLLTVLIVFRTNPTRIRALVEVNVEHGPTYKTSPCNHHESQREREKEVLVYLSLPYKMDFSRLAGKGYELLGDNFSFTAILSNGRLLLLREPLSVED